MGHCGIFTGVAVTAPPSATPLCYRRTGNIFCVIVCLGVSSSICVMCGLPSTLPAAQMCLVFALNVMSAPLLWWMMISAKTVTALAQRVIEQNHLWHLDINQTFFCGCWIGYCWSEFWEYFGTLEKIFFFSGFWKIFGFLRCALVWSETNWQKNIVASNGLLLKLIFFVFQPNGKKEQIEPPNRWCLYRQQ